MKIHKVWAENVRGIRKRIDIEPALTGTTLFHAPNEYGKTTLSEVITYLFKFPSSSNSQIIQGLVPVGRDVGPTMGATIEVNGDLYVIEKRWIKDRKTEFSVSGSKNIQLSGANAEKAIDELFESNINESFWDLLQLGQSEFASLIDSEFDVDFVADLQNLLDLISSNEEDAEADSLFERAENEYFKWFTSTGNPKVAVNTQGRKIKELEEELIFHKKNLRDLEEKIDENDKITVEFDAGKVNRVELQKTYDAQQLHNRISELEKLQSSKKLLQKRLSEYLYKFPRLESFSEEEYVLLQSLYPLSLKYSALRKVKLTALKNIDITVNGTSKRIDMEGELEIALESPLDINIEGLVKLSYHDDEFFGGASLEDSFEKFNLLLREMGCSSYAEAEQMSRSYSEWRRDSEQLGDYEKEFNKTVIDAELASNKSRLNEIEDWENLIRQTLVPASALHEAVKVEGIQEGRWLQINQNGWDASLNNEVVAIRELEKSLVRLKGQREAVKLLYETLREKRESSARNLVPVFTEKLNEVAAVYYGEPVSFQVSDGFKIESRFKDGSTVRIGSLSTGAKEQLAILIRVTLSRLIQKNDSVPVFFDDEFGHSDQDKIDAIERVFEDFGDGQQFILMTCYPEKFKNVSFALKKSLV